MSDFLTNLATRSFDPKPAIRPRLASLYEPLPTPGKMMVGVLFDPPDPDREESGDASFSDSASLFRRPQPVPTTPAATAAQPSWAAPAHQSNDAAKTPQASDRPGEIFRGTESAPNKSRPREIGAERPREPSPTDFSEPQRLSSDPVVPTAMVQSPQKETSPRHALTPSPSSKSMNDNSEANPEHDTHKDVPILESLIDQRIREPHDATSATQLLVSSSQMVASPSSGTEEANRIAFDQVVNSTIKSIVPTRESQQPLVSVEDLSLTETSVQTTTSVEKAGRSAPGPPVHPVTIERIVSASELPPQFVSAEDVSLTRTSVQRTASADKAELNAPSSAVHPVTIERIVQASELPPQFISDEGVSPTGTSVQKTASAEEARLRFASPAVHPVTIERIVPTRESPRPPSISAKELSPSRTTVPMTPATIAVQPQNISPTRPVAEALASSPAPEPNVQVTIGRIEIRAIKEAEVKPKNERAVQSTLMSLDDYLRQRAQGGKR
jgi:hypothetical protein